MIFMNYYQKLEKLLGREIQVISCPKHCDNGYRGCDACNFCEKTGSGFRIGGVFYPNSESGWKRAVEYAESGGINKETNMNEADRQTLLNVKQRLDGIAKDLKVFHEKGIVVQFGINGQAGTVENFKVQHLVEVDIDKKAN